MCENVDVSDLKQICNTYREQKIFNFSKMIFAHTYFKLFSVLKIYFSLKQVKKLSCPLQRQQGVKVLKYPKEASNVVKLYGCCMCHHNVGKRQEMSPRTPSIHLFIVYHLSGIVSQEQRSPDRFLSHLLQHTEAFPGQPRDVISSMCSALSTTDMCITSDAASIHLLVLSLPSPLTEPPPLGSTTCQ